MASGSRAQLCRVCGGPLQGNQRRWLFGGPNRRSAAPGGPPGTPTGSHPGGRLSRSSQSSPWGSTLSLGSSGSLSRSQWSLSSSSSPSSRAVDLLAVLTHILGRAVPRGDAHGEFVCGKCVSVLERVFRFDSVISRVRVLSAERLQRLTRERDQIRQWVRQSYGRAAARGGGGGAEGGAEDGGGGGDGDAYRDLLRDDMALSEFECWSERWDACPFFIRTGKRCRHGNGCEGCDSLRVADSVYEAVCGIPRHLPPRTPSPSPLSRDKSRSMPLHWHGSGTGSGPGSLAGSTASLLTPSLLTPSLLTPSRTPSRASSRAPSRASSRAPSQTLSRTVSLQSLDSLDSLDSQDVLETPGRSLDLLLRELRDIRGTRLSSPSGSRIPVLDRRDRRTGGASPLVGRTLSFAEDGADRGDGDDGDVPTELGDDFLPLHPENGAGPLHAAIRFLQGQLDQALDHIRTLEDQLEGGRSHGSEVNGEEERNNHEGGSRWRGAELQAGGGGRGGGGGGGDAAVLQTLQTSLHSRERLIQECLALIGTLSEKHGSSPALIDTLSHSLKELLSQNKDALQAVSGDMSQKQKNLQAELETLQRTGQDRDRDLDTLNAVLRGNQDLINDLQEALQQQQQQAELWRRTEDALRTLLRDKEQLIQQLERAAGGGDGPALSLDVDRLSRSLEDVQQLLQSQQQGQRSSATRASRQLQQNLGLLREEQRRRREEQRLRAEQGAELRRLEAGLRAALTARDTLIQEILQDAEQRDVLMRELQEKNPAVTHTL
ncbi:uncharacterized protein LOC115397348 [Salarias fasciatus]|uniref:uncharacterized protein LOC115397348 n=1 Tax=Salarias fasciatus TaxID=181472 RepID=UPI001176EA00|nr:uncharacterized protein LOC115397348 [Salarias fasciatus]XP_029959462.1 uncharacterized protein LOC115397348 [Salarias fasciatus]